VRGKTGVDRDAGDLEFVTRKDQPLSHGNTDF
jgi:hypothetical protein